MPTIIGMSSSPETAADVPDAICRNVGRKPIAANIPMPSTIPIAEALMKIGLRNRLSGMIGSSARASVMTKAAPARSIPAPHAQVAPEPQPKSSLPPKSVKKMRHVVVIDRNSTPSRSMRFVAFLVGSVSVNRAITNAAMPIGMLM